eukprot:m.169797 g.169797  ORF g.169797 m.169797 type:complete len:71 (+) comp14509_c0_seq2:539-751(+)
MNNCVGAKSYKMFFLCISAGGVASILEGILCLYTIIQVFANPHKLAATPGPASVVFGNGFAQSVLVCVCF